jgi:hypothetical protein
MLSNELLDALELHALTIEDDCHISLHAIPVTQSNKVIHLRALVKNQVMSILINSGSSHSFLNASMISRLQCQAIPAKPMIVKVENGQRVPSDMIVPNFEWWLQGHTFNIDARVLDLAAYDLILGMDWLEQHRPMTCDWLMKWLEFEYKGGDSETAGYIAIRYYINL